MSQTSPLPQPFLERLSDGLQQLIQVVIGSHRKPPRRLRSLLNGTWFGHPLSMAPSSMSPYQCYRQTCMQWPPTCSGSWRPTCCFSPPSYSWAGHSAITLDGGASSPWGLRSSPWRRSGAARCWFREAWRSSAPRSAMSSVESYWHLGRIYFDHRSRGPVLGGWLGQYASWRWVFFINVPLAVLVLGVVFWRVPESRDENSQRGLDWWGALLMALGLDAIVYGLIEVGTLGVSDPLVLVTLAVGIVALGAFLLVEAALQAPMVPLSLFRSLTLSGVNLQTLLLYAALGGITFFFPFDLMQVQGYSPTAAGAALVPFLLLVFLFSRLADGSVDRYGARLPLVVGPVITAVGFALFAVPAIGGNYWVTFFPTALLMGVSMAINVAPMATVVRGAVEQRHAGIASAVNNAVARAASLLAIAVLGIVIIAWHPGAHPFANPGSQVHARASTSVKSLSPASSRVFRSHILD